MKIPLIFSVAASKSFVSKAGGHFVKISCSAIGLGIFEIVVPEALVPDQLEGRTVKGIFTVYVGRDFTLRFGLDSIEGFVE